MGITPPQVPPRVRNPDGNMHLRIQPNEVTAAYPLTDHHVGSILQHRPIPRGDVSDAEARLLVRPSMYGEAQEISRNRWQFARDELGAAVSDPEWVRLRPFEFSGNRHTLRIRVAGPLHTWPLRGGPRAHLAR